MQALNNQRPFLRRVDSDFFEALKTREISQKHRYRDLYLESLKKLLAGDRIVLSTFRTTGALSAQFYSCKSYLANINIVSLLSHRKTLFS